MLYDPLNPAEYTSVGVSYIDLETGSRVFDTQRMNVAKDENGVKLNQKLD